MKILHSQMQGAWEHLQYHPVEGLDYLSLDKLKATTFLNCSFMYLTYTAENSSSIYFPWMQKC